MEDSMTLLCEAMIKYFERYPEAKEELSKLLSEEFADWDLPELDDIARFTGEGE